MYRITTLSPQNVLGPLAEAEDSLARLDERILKSEIADGWRNRADFYDATASLWIEGELVSLEDLVLHDAMMDVRAPTEPLARALSVVRLRRHIAASENNWRKSALGVAKLIGRHRKHVDQVEQTYDVNVNMDDTLSELLADVDTALSRTTVLLQRRPTDDDFFQDEESRDEKLSEWLEVVAETDTLPPTLAAVIAEDAWTQISPLEFDRGEGRLMAAALLAQRRKTKAHFAIWNAGARLVNARLRRDRNPSVRYIAGLNAISAGASEGLRRHDTWLTAKRLLERKARGRRSSSSLPKLIDFLIATPLASASMISKELRISQRAALDLVSILDVREITGRGRFRAWSIM